MPSKSAQLAVHRFEFKAMGTRCDIRLFAPDGEAAARVFLACAEEVNRLEHKYSRYRPGNFLHRINLAAQHGGEAQADAECMSLLDYAHACHLQSEGLFDITSGILRKAWNFDSAALPDPALLERTLQSVGWRHVQRDGLLLRFARKGMELDFGGIVKEYAVDRAVAICRGMGMAHGVVDLGGDIGAIGPDPDGEPWRIGIRHPRAPEREVASIAIAQGALATSGDYERCIEIGGQRYSHILSPVTGWPVQGLASVTVVAEQCVVAGSISTTAMLKEGAGAAWLASLGVPHVWVDLDGNIGGSPEGGRDSNKLEIIQ